MNNWAAFYKASAELFQFLHQSGRLLFGDEEQLKAMFDESIEEQQRFLQIVIQLNEPDDLIIFEGLLVNYVLVKLRRTLLSENFHTPMGSSHCWLYAAV